jgi:hypothetical protein
LGLENVGFGDHFISCAQIFAWSGSLGQSSSYARSASVAARRLTQRADCLANGSQLIAKSYSFKLPKIDRADNTCLRFVLQSK